MVAEDCEIYRFGDDCCGTAKTCAERFEAASVKAEDPTPPPNYSKTAAT
jgi:hypothetical protein